MATLYILHDFGISMPWNFTAIHANADLLAQNNIALAPFNPWTQETVPTHNEFFWLKLKAADAPQGLLARLKHIRELLADGKNILLLNVGIYLPGHEIFAELLAQNGFAGHEIKPIFVLGRPLCLFEKRWRWAGTIPDKDRIDHLRRFANLHQLLEVSRQRYDCLELIADLAESPQSRRQDDLTARIFAAMGCPAPKYLDELPPHPLIFGSVAARQLFAARAVRSNAWPPLDERAFKECLYALDEKWDQAVIAPRKLRSLLCIEGSVSQAYLEKEMALPTGALDAPAWLLEAKEESAYAPPDAEQVRALSIALPQTVTLPLRQRLRNDVQLLTPIQQRLLESLETVFTSMKIFSNTGFSIRPTAISGEDVPAIQRCENIFLKNRPETDFAHIGEPEQSIELTVLTMAYNQEQFIGQCLDSVLAQRTDFPVRHLVLDHCSNDDTPRIVAEYAARHPSIRPVLLDRHIASENVLGLFQRCRSRFAALCDGDDYFTDEEKLQLQVDALLQNPGWGLVFHPVEGIFEDGSKPFVYPAPEQLPRVVRREYHLLDLVRRNFIQTNSVVYRWRFADGLPDWFRGDLCPGDWYWHLLHAETGRIGFLPRVMSVYRRHNNALFIDNIKNPMQHRKKMGLGELEFLKTANEHFKGRYFASFAKFADNVFSDFVIIAQEEGDLTYIDAAVAKYTDFGRHFLDECAKKEKSH